MNIYDSVFFFRLEMLHFHSVDIRIERYDIDFLLLLFMLGFPYFNVLQIVHWHMSARLIGCISGKATTLIGIHHLNDLLGLVEWTQHGSFM